MKKENYQMEAVWRERRSVKRKEKKKRYPPLPSNDEQQLRWPSIHSSFLRMHCHLPASRQNASQEKVVFIPNCTILSLPESPCGLWIHLKQIPSRIYVRTYTSAFARYAEKGNTLARWGTQTPAEDGLGCRTRQGCSGQRGVGAPWSCALWRMERSVHMARSY